jgi:hypothetical protein
MKNQNQSIKVRGWTITAETFSDPRVLVDIASPCDKYGCSLACAEMTGEAMRYGGDDPDNAVVIPVAVIDAATVLEESYYT